MISMRYHIVSLAAVFLALALGIVLGATKISGPMLTSLQGDNASLSTQQDELAAENAELTDRVSSDDNFAGSVAALAVRGTLPATNVVLITTAGADPADRDAVLSLLNRAGATVTAQIQVTNDFSDPLRADELRSIAATTLPTGATLPEVPQAGAVAGGLLSPVLIAPAGAAAAASPEQAAAVLAPAAGQSVVILTGAEVTGGSEADKAAAVAYLANQLAQSATGVVVAGRTGSEQATGTVGVIRGDTALSATVTTVDNVEAAAGRVATVLGLVEQNGGGVGRYGLGENAQAQVPTLAVG
jgi:hypothetical protein